MATKPAKLAEQAKPAKTKSPKNTKLPEKTEFSSMPLYRNLRGYAIDPSLALQLKTAPVSEVLFKIPWEESLWPGPLGEYLEVIDYDPVSQCFYEPVDLNAPDLLAQDGLPPSEGTPQFHQQMVYAVSQLTIHNFERALGRRTLWAPSDQAEYQNQNLDGFVRQLRIYPHALRDANAYYSPSKKSLLFGYFLASESDTNGEHIPGGMVFTCLSHDIIAHETTHALLDGLHRRFNRATNKDMLAFHEAFADIVALFQHFTFPEILKHQIAETHGVLDSQENLLSELAGQFGRANGARGALRNAIGGYDKDGLWKRQKPDPSKYKTTTEPHELGSILVAAIFDAFISIYNKRIADLLRIYTGGTGVLPAGALHPDLVARLSNEASKAAKHVLAMCVRALDYCPPVDLTFGEYLRAIVTADIDLVPEDDLNYRVAFVEAFRRWGIYPRNLRTLSVENLIWRSPTRNDEYSPSEELNNIFTYLRIPSYRHLYAGSRKELFEMSSQARRKLHSSLKNRLQVEVDAKQNEKSEPPDGHSKTPDCDLLGLKVPETGELKFEVESLDYAGRTGPDGDLLLQAIVQIVQEEESDGQQMIGGCTLIVDLKKSEIAYSIRKPIRASRQVLQNAYRQGIAGTPLRDTYFGSDPSNKRKEPFALLHRMDI